MIQFTLFPVASESAVLLPSEFSVWLWLGLKVLFILGFLIYLAFAFIVIRQVQVMTKAFKTSAEPFLKLLSYLHLLLAVAVLLFAFLIL